MPHACSRPRSASYPLKEGRAMPTLADENRDLRRKVAQLERALGQTALELTNRVPALACSDVMIALTLPDPANAIDFYSEVFGAREGFRVPDKDGRVAFAALQVGTAQVAVNAETPELRRVSPKDG